MDGCETMAKILIIDDDPQLCRMLAQSFTKMDHTVQYALTLTQGLETLFSDTFDVIFLDVNLPDGNGLEAIDTIRDHPALPEIIIMTGLSDPEGAELAMKSRVWDYIQKSGSHKEFQFSLTRALKYRQQKADKSREYKIKRKSIVGESRGIKACLELASKASNNDVPVLVTGETGTGKELFAKAIHENSPRQPNNFIVVDCAALPENLVESALFGHKKGAFTGADTDKAGLIEMADAGTLFLDEVGELPVVIQKKFLRVLQEKRFRPIGGKKEISSDFRLVAATHRDLPDMVKQGGFREDFYFRISSLAITIPPLRKRKEDIPLLVKHHMDKKRILFDEAPPEVSDQLVEDFLLYNWPGNVRELINALDHACSDAFYESIIFSKHLPEHIRSYNIKSKIRFSEAGDTAAAAPEKQAPVLNVNLKDYVEMAKQKYLKDLISHTRGDINTACRLSGLSRGHLYSLLKKYGVRSG